MYCNKNFKTKKALKEAVEKGEKHGVFQPGPFGGQPQKEGKATLSGPHFPQPHKWYAEVELKDGYIVKVK